MTESAWCILCEDRPPEGQFVVVVEGTDQIVRSRRKPPPTHVCAFCGKNFEGSEVATNEETGQVAVLKYQPWPKGQLTSRKGET